ncbi:protein Niban 1a [Solea solea]|uniref:protein Niban 1a n=1 Tax=Solea solea TaxID=90069 RepID=UPI00272A3B72|nr:protein Niban 1a [Solea solea]
MGVSASSLLDDNKSNYIKGQAEAELTAFSPYYMKQFSVARFSQVEDDLEQQKDNITQLLKQREAPQDGEVLYEEAVLYFDDTRKWKERYVVVRANYCLECHEGLDCFVKGVPPHHKLLPTGGSVLTTEEKYMAMVDKCFPDDTNVKEDFAPPLSGMPGQFPVYLRLPYRRDSYFCFKQQAKQEAFLSILSDCIRHQNQDFLKKKTCEVQAFVKAVQLYRQDKGKYEVWDMLIGSDVRVMANMVMEQLLPTLEKDMLPRLKAKKTERKRVWFATVEAAYILVQEHLLEGLSALKEDCRMSVRNQEVLIHSEMDQILNCRKELEEKVQAKVSESALKLCSESVQPYLASVLEELMEPVSSGFQEGQHLSESMMDKCQDVLAGGDKEQLKKALTDMTRPNLLSCYQKIGSLQEKLHHLRDRFGFSNITGVIHSAQLDLQMLMQNAAYTFEQLQHKALQDNPDNPSSALEKAKHRVLKQYDYDSSTVRKRIFQDALVSITLPFIKKRLAPTCKTELQGLEQFIYADYSNFIHVDNVFESILLRTLDKEVTKVVKEAASLQKYNLFTDSRDVVSQSSRSSLSSPSASIPGSPAMALSSPSKTSVEPQPTSPLVANDLSSSPREEEQKEKESSGLKPVEVSTSVDTSVIETLVSEVEQKECAQTVAVGQETAAPEAEGVFHTVKVEADAESAALANTASSNETPDVSVTAETVIQEAAVSVETLPDDPVTQSTDVVEEVTHLLTDVDILETEAKTEAPALSPGPAVETEPTSAVGAGSEDSSEGDSGIKVEAPSGGEAPVLTPGDVALDEASDPNSLSVSMGSESPPSDIESTENIRTTQSSEDEVSTTSDVLQDDADISKSPVSSDETPEDTNPSDGLPSQTQAEAASDVHVQDDMEAAVSAGVEAADVTATVSPEAATEEAASSPGAQPPDSIKDIRDLVVEVIEVEELVQRYPSGIPMEE